MKCLVFILIVTCSLSVYTQNNYTLSGTVIKSSDISLDEYGALLLDDSCAFHVVDNWGKIIIPNVCEWGFGVEVEQGNYVKVKVILHDIDLVSRNRFSSVSVVITEYKESVSVSVTKSIVRI